MASKSVRVPRPALESPPSNRLIALTVAVTFVVSFAFLYWKQGLHRSPPLAAPAPEVAPPAPAIVRPPGAAAAVPVPPAPPPRAAAPPETFDGPPLPVMLNIAERTLRPGEKGSADGSTGVPEARIKSSSDQALSITILAVNLPTMRTSRADVLLPPGGEAQFGPDDGLPMQPGDQVTVRSSGFSVLTETVP